jgi:predicted nucleotide-binding protein
MYEAFNAVGQWPIFSYISGELWRESRKEAREVYLRLSERRLVYPATPRSHEFQLRDDSKVGASLLGLTYIPNAAEDLMGFLAAVRYIANRAGRFRPASPSEVERLTITSEEIMLHLGIDPTSPVLTRIGVLIADEGWPLQTGFHRPGQNDWSLDVNLEQARRYANVHTIPDFLDLKHQGAPSPRPRATLTKAQTTQRPPTYDNNKVMVVHGRDLKARDALFNLLRALKLDPIEWNEAVRASGSATPYTGDAVAAAFGIAHAAIVLCTPDEAVVLRPDLRNSAEPAEAVAEWQPRPNVYFEGGIAFTSHPNRTVVLMHGRVRMASDLLGRNVVETSSTNWKHRLAQRLADAGCPVDQAGEDWLNVAFPPTPPTTPNLAEWGLVGSFQDATGS